MCDLGKLSRVKMLKICPSNPSGYLVASCSVVLTDLWFLQVDVFVLQGRMDEARHLLSKEASANPTSMSMYKVLDDLMMKMPVPNVCIFF